MRLAPRPLRATPLLALAVVVLLAVVALASHGALHGGLGHGPVHDRLARLPKATSPLTPPRSRGDGAQLDLPHWLLWAALGLLALAVAVVLGLYARVGRMALARVALTPPAQGTATALEPDEEDAQRRLREIVDRSLEDLRSDPNARRAIIGAYHLMERALERAALARDPAEAPREYLARALGALQVGPAAPRRLTALFERARFGAGELDLGLRDEAIDALLALRGELAR
jgi:hypothetical protein